MHVLRRALRREDDPSATQRDVAHLFVHVAAQLGVTFDFSDASVPLLDAWVDRLWDPAGPRPSEDELDSNTKLIGAYLGEVIIQSVGGRWVWSQDPKQPAIEVRPGQIALPLNRAYKRQVNGSGETIQDFFLDVKRRAADAPE